MSELKVYVKPIKTNMFGKMIVGQSYYLKSEADKVIEEKDEIIDELKEHIDELQKATDSAWSKVNAIYDELRHQKYKRCLAMWLYLRECYWRCKHHNEKTRADWYEKWMDIFKKLAEHYKAAK